VGGVSKKNWGSTVKRPNTENFQPPKNKLVSEQLSDHATNSYPHPAELPELKTIDTSLYQHKFLYQHNVLFAPG
jgi:hypothetical protein